MPRSILVLLGTFFVLTVWAQTFLTLAALARPDAGASVRPRMLVGLVAINGFAAFLTYALVCDRRWRARWRAFQGYSPELLARLEGDTALLDPAKFLAAIPEEPANVYLEQPFQCILSWDRTRRGFEWLNRPDAEELIATGAFKVLTDMRLRGAYIGRTFHDTDRVAASFDAGPVRALRTQSGGSLSVYTFRIDRGRQHLVATFAVKRDGNIITLGWHQAALRATWFDTLRFSKFWCLFMLVGATVLPELLVLTLAYALISYPPGRGWTSMWAKITRDRLNQQFNAAGESWAERMDFQSFEQNVSAAFVKLSSTQLTR